MKGKKQSSQKRSLSSKRKALGKAEKLNYRKLLFPVTLDKIAAWKEQPDVLGILLVGSKSRGHADKFSDDDLEVILSTRAYKRLQPGHTGDYLITGEGTKRKVIYDAQLMPLTELQGKAKIPRDLYHWPYERAGIVFDRDGRVAKAVQAAAEMDAEFRRTRLLHATIDVFTAAGRGAKAARRKSDCATRLIVARGVKALARLIFALEWRWVPLDHWLEAELMTLDDPTHATKRLLEALINSDPKPLREALEQLEDVLCAEGVPPRSKWIELLFELIHSSRVQERAIHGLF